jgi:hypothetical protein
MFEGSKVPCIELAYIPAMPADHGSGMTYSWACCVAQEKGPRAVMANYGRCLLERKLLTTR